VNLRRGARSCCGRRHLCYGDVMRTPALPDPNDPLAPRPDDPALFRRMWWRRLYDRPAPGTSALRNPLIVVAMLTMLGLVALAVVLLGQR
jgi:hypothetical protein